MVGDGTVLKQFLGDEDFPVEWANEEEKNLFWFFDDLHCPTAPVTDVLRHRRVVADL